MVILRGLLDGLELGRLADATIRVVLASAALAAASLGVWEVLDDALGRGLVGQIASLGAALAIGGLVYLAAARLLRIAELAQVMRLVRRG
jgi:putative peptidoglycan lipid II flippase